MCHTQVLAPAPAPTPSPPVEVPEDELQAEPAGWIVFDPLTCNSSEAFTTLHGVILCRVPQPDDPIPVSNFLARPICMKPLKVWNLVVAV